VHANRAKGWERITRSKIARKQEQRFGGVVILLAPADAGVEDYGEEGAKDKLTDQQASLGISRAGGSGASSAASGSDRAKREPQREGRRSPDSQAAFGNAPGPAFERQDPD